MSGTRCQGCWHRGIRWWYLTPEGTDGQPRVASSLASQVADIEDLMAALHIQSAHLVGISMGGVEALAYYQAHASRVRSLTLVDSFASLGVQGIGWVRDKEEQLQRESMDQFARAYTDTTLRPSTPAPTRELLYQAVASVTPQDYLDASRACFLADLDAGLSHVAVPTLVLIGSHDTRTPMPFSEHLASLIPDAELDVVPEAGHLSSMDNPSFVGDRIGRFLAGQ